ncbi:TonB-dependent receptor [Pseudomonas sp. LRF_L74]|uniref:TonB-dependent receptor n=1 Tax=Pseudomonas sp. LRF_L74 TaxID=3369422 RepID=UPI003F5ED5D0
MKYYSQFTFTRGFSVLSLSTLLGATAVMADESTSNTKEVLTFEPIMVTGEKIERDLKDTAAAVSVKSGKDIDKEKTGNASVQEVITDVPNVLYTNSISAPIIRGQDTQGPHNGATVFWGGTVPRATINLDGHYLNYHEVYYGATSVWDLDNIEIFRGPQTTSQGANAIAGAIIVKTKDPTFTPEGAYQAEIGNYNSRRYSVAASGPLVGEDLAGRFTVDYSSRDTFIDYTSPTFSKGKSDDQFRALNLRGKLLWLPSDIEGLETKLTLSHAEYNRPSQESASASYSDLEHIGGTMPSWKQNADSAVLDISYALSDELKLFNQTQYSESHVKRYIGGTAGGNADIQQDNASNETRLSFGDAQSTFSGMGGVYVAKTSSDEILWMTVGNSSFDDTKENFGLFGETNYRLTDRWTLGTGLRYQQDKVDRQGTSAYASTPVDYQETFSEILPKVSLAFAVTPDWTVGGMISKGYNPGGVSLNTSARSWQYFDKETVWNYELFSRASLLDNRLQLSGNLFYMKHKDAQYSIPVVLTSGVTNTYTINAEKAHAYGIELSADYQLLDNLRLKASAGTLRTRIDKIASNNAYQGNDFAKSPGYNLSFGPSWDVTDRWNLSMQVRYTDGYYSDVANTKSYAVDSYTLTDLRTSYRFSKQVEVYGYVKNLFDDRSPTYFQASRTASGTTFDEASMTSPRMFGVGVKGSF